MQDVKDHDDENSSSENEDIRVGDMIGGVPIAAFLSVTFDDSKFHNDQIGNLGDSNNPPAPEIISHRLYQA